MIDRQGVLENEHFRLERLADGVYAAINTVTGGAMSNAGIVDLGGETLVFDAFVTRTAAQALRTAAEELTGRAPRYLINSHSHGDHVWGNPVFRPEATILATAATIDAMAAEGSADIDPDELKSFIERSEETLADEPDELARANIEGNLYPRKWLYEELPVEVALPTMALDSNLVIRGEDRAVRLVSHGRAHTAGDLVLICPDDRIVFLGDLGFFQDQPPYIAPDGDAAAWALCLSELEELRADAYVPGHGEVAGVERLSAQRGFLEAVVGAAREVVRDGGSIDQLSARMHETEYVRWEGAMLYTASLQSVLTQLGANVP
jgi:glyoxylase-like metal-dependent hydrolase (beta-lactamase superfamily II)